MSEIPATTPVARGAYLADPAPLGLAAFALTTFVLSFMNTGTFKEEPVVFGLALAYGGFAQVLAGMWEFAKGNTFGATAFTSFGAFWLSFWYLTGHTALVASGNDINKGVGLYLLAWGIFTAYMLVASLGTDNQAVQAVFLLLTITFFLLAFGKFGTAADATGPVALTKVGGWFGLATAIAAWYASFAGVAASTFKRPVLPTSLG